MGDDLTFYAVSAQVLPTFVLAVVIAMRQRPTRQGWANNWPNAIALALPLLMPLVGTVAALRVLETGHPTDLAETLIWIGIGTAMGTVLVFVLEIIQPRSDPFADDPDEKAPRRSKRRPSR